MITLTFKQRLFSWFDSYDIYDESGNTVFTVKGQLAWGHCLKVYDAYGRELATLKEKILTFMPKFEVYFGNRYIGCISKELTFFRDKFNIDYSGWQVEGDLWDWNYSILDRSGNAVAAVMKQLRLTDTYLLNIFNPENALAVVMLVLAIDAEKCSNNE